MSYTQIQYRLFRGASKYRKKGQPVRGSVSWQVTEVFKTIQHFGSSRHNAKEQAISRLKASAQSTSRHNIGKNTGVYSFKTAHDYKAIACQAFKFARTEHGVKSITHLRGDHIQSFLESKISSGSINLTTYRTYAAALQKFEQALNRYAEESQSGDVYQFSESIKNTQEDAGAILKTGGEATRAYQNPKALIEKIETPDFRLAAMIQYEGGNRVREVGHIREHQLGGIETRIDRGEVGRIDLTRGNTKGGKERSVYVSKDTYWALKARIDGDEKKEFRVLDQDRYREALKKAASDSDQKYTGSHGLRWNYAQESMDRYQRMGASYEQALAKVSEDMGHVRPDITEHYLK